MLARPRAPSTLPSQAHRHTHAFAVLPFVLFCRPTFNQQQQLGPVFVPCSLSEIGPSHPQLDVPSWRLKAQWQTCSQPVVPPHGSTALEADGTHRHSTISQVHTYLPSMLHTSYYIGTVLELQATTDSTTVESSYHSSSQQLESVASLPACQPACLASLSCPPVCLSACLSACLPGPG